MPAETRKTGRICPNCKKPVPSAARICPGCKLEVAKMAGFEAALAAAQRKGKRTTRIVEDEKPPRQWPAWLSPGTMTLAVFCILVLLGAWWFFRPKPPRYLAYPNTREAAVTEFFKHIATGDSLEYDKAYAMVPDSVRDPSDDDERGHYRGLFHAMYKYLGGEFGGDWAETARLEPDPANSDLIIAKVGLETLHVHVKQETPPGNASKDGQHYGVTGVDEFNINDAAGFQKMEAILGVVQGVAGSGSVHDLKTIIGAAGPRRRETPMQTKVRMLPIIRNPRETSRRAIVQTWPAREDPVMRKALEDIMADGRFEPDVRQTAKQVLDGTLDETDRNAVGIDEYAVARGIGVPPMFRDAGAHHSFGVAVFSTARKQAQQISQQLLAGHCTLIAWWTLRHAGVLDAIAAFNADKKEGLQPMVFATRTSMSHEVLTALLEYLEAGGLVALKPDGAYLTLEGKALLEHEDGVLELIRAYQPVLDLSEHLLAKLKSPSGGGANRKLDSLVASQAARYPDEVYPAVAELLAKQKLVHILDIACGSGDLLLYAAKQHKKIVGVGIGADGIMVRKANERISTLDLEKRLIAVAGNPLDVCAETERTFTRIGISRQLWHQFDCLIAANVFSELAARNGDAAPITAALAGIPRHFPKARLLLIEPVATTRFDKNYYAPELSLLLKLSKSLPWPVEKWRDTLKGAKLAITQEVPLVTDGLVIFVCKAGG